MGKFKIGDRVRVIDADGGGKLGDIATVIRIKGGYYELNGLSRGANGLYEHRLELVRSAAPDHAITIEAGKFYKTRDGRKVGPMEKMWDGKFNGIGAMCKRVDGTITNNPQRYLADGSVFMKRNGEEDDTLIAEWVDEPVAVAPAKPKFKVGDIVKFRDDYGSSARGKKATVVNVYSWGIQVDLGGDYGVSTERPYSLELLPTATTPPTAIVALIENDQPKPATRPKIHVDQQAATAEAERLALAYPGQEFGVFVLADSKIADTVKETVTRSVLRAA